MSEKETRNSCHFGDLLHEECHKTTYSRSTGLRRLDELADDIQHTYLWRAGLLDKQQEIETICFHHEQLLGNVFERRNNSSCCGVLIKHQKKVVGKKRITLVMADILESRNHNVVPGHMLCRHCVDVYDSLSITDEQSENEDPVAEPNSSDDMDEAADVDYEVLETPRKKLNSSLKMVGVSPVNLHGIPQHSRAKSARQKLEKVMDN